MPYQAPTTLMQVLGNIEYDKALDVDDERYVDTRAARGSDKTLTRLARKLGLDIASGVFVPPLRGHILL